MHFRLLTKFTLVTSGALLLAMLFFSWNNVRSLKNFFLEEEIKNVDNLSETIIQTTHYQMLENDRKRVYQMIQEVGTQKGVEYIRLVNKDGFVIFSTDRAEIGTLLDKKADACNMCHGRGKPLLKASSMSRSRLFKDRKGKEVLGIAKGIYSDPSCLSAACHFHTPNAKLLGVLDVTVSLQSMNARIASYRHEIIILIVSLLGLLLLSLTILTHRLIHRPVRQFLNHTRRLASGDLESRIETSSGDELGELATSFNTMALNLKKARDELREWADTLEMRVEERTSEIKKIQSELLQSEKLAALGEMSAGIAHEVNNPLTGILMFASMLHEDPRLHPELKNDLLTILEETRRCAKIVRGLLEFSRKSLPQKVLTSVNDLLETVLELVEHQEFFFDIEVVRKYDPALPQTLLDPNQIEQVFMNIILNAAQAIPDGGRMTIETGIRPSSPWIFARIVDNGCGISGDHLEKIFDPFFSTKGAQGTGLGLSVSYGIVENHGGQIEVESCQEENNGTTFTVLLPILEDEDNQERGQV
ncbi:MAG TPA: ATP-binding protein [Desulfuromonadales bacterium]|nr:ATP-binding protein [Desulfuromonadales bacterium]